MILNREQRIIRRVLVFHSFRRWKQKRQKCEYDGFWIGDCNTLKDSRGAFHIVI